MNTQIRIDTYIATYTRIQIHTRVQARDDHTQYKLSKGGGGLAQSVERSLGVLIGCTAPNHVIARSEVEVHHEIYKE